MRDTDSLLREISCMCGYMEISDLHFEPFKTRAKAVLEYDKHLNLRYTSEQLFEAKRYIGK